MTHYIDIKIKEKTKVKKNWIRNAIFLSLHKRLFDLNNKNIGISFPNKGENLGDILRIHGTENELIKLNSIRWIEINEVLVSPITKVPYKHSFVIISRVQSKRSNSKLNRLIKRNNLTKKEIIDYRKKMLSNPLDNFFIEIKSNSSNKLFKLFFSFKNLNNLSEGEFNNYGLSKTGTVPLF